MTASSSDASHDLHLAAEAAAAPAAAPEAAADLTDVLAGRFMIPAAEAAELRRAHGLTEQQLLQALIVPAAKLARPPISNYHVG